MDSKDSGRIGGKRRAAALTPEERSESARQAARVRWSRLSADQRSALGRLRVMARWNRKEKATVDDYSRATAIRVEVENSESSNSRQTIKRLGAIAKYASDLSLKYLGLPVHDRSGRAQLLSEFRFEVAEFFKQRARLLEDKRYQRNQSDS